MKTTIYVPDIECDSCNKLIRKKCRHLPGVVDLHFDADSVTISHDAEHVSKQLLVESIRDLGFRASFEPIERITLGERWRHFKENKHKYAHETKLFKYTLGIFLLLTLLEGGAYFLFLQNMPDFLNNYGWWLFYLNISVATLGVGIWHVASYKAKITCMTGMMIGMTFGMQAGMMIGAVMGATNGFFIGAMAGMLLGVIVGSITGQCCGVMGIMEGMMAGLMGGTMGPMITVMMFSDHLLIFMPFYIILNLIILWGLAYMMYEEVVENKRGVKRTPADFSIVAAASIIITVILIGIMIWGPKSPLVSF
ncbi:MAG: heavy-metal-associated domain-containing protein [Nanoarchaeota archaeon]